MMTKDDWKYIEEQWGLLYTSTKLEIDGYKITLQAHVSKMKIKMGVYVNGYMSGKDLVKDKNGTFTEIANRFFLKTKHQFLTNKELKERIKLFGKKDPLSQQKYYESVSPFYTSFPSFKKQIIKNNKDIQLIRSDHEQI